MAYSAVKNKSDQQANSARIKILVALFLLLGGLIIFRLFILQIIKHSLYEQKASGQHEILEKLMPERGKIYIFDKDGNLFNIAGNEELYLLFAAPPEIESATATIKAISNIIGWEQETQEKIFGQLNKVNDPYEPLAHYLSGEQKKQIASLEIAGLYFSLEGKRIYQEGSAFAHLTGFLGYQGDRRVGQYGLEEYFEQKLRGDPGILKSGQHNPILRFEKSKK